MTLLYTTGAFVHFHAWSKSQDRWEDVANLKPQNQAMGRERERKRIRKAQVEEQEKKRLKNEIVAMCQWCLEIPMALVQAFTQYVLYHT